MVLRPPDRRAHRTETLTGQSQILAWGCARGSKSEAGQSESTQVDPAFALSGDSR